ncbi:MAG: LytR C-terminal domain-containing protein [Melioribacteraceae bacterium]|nr:LytR C-terminal domain-containing protein [Melioribacteraceae bacterium]
MAVNKKTENNSDSKKSIQNIALNIVIFLLGSLIIYLSFSIYIKLNDKELPALPEKNREVASDIIQVEVLNGCGIGGVADRFTDYLRRNNFDVVSSGNYVLNGGAYFDVAKTMVIDRSGNMANAKKIAASLGVNKANVFQQLNKDYFLDVSIIIGKDYLSLEPTK